MFTSEKCRHVPVKLSAKCMYLCLTAQNFTLSTGIWLGTSYRFSKSSEKLCWHFQNRIHIIDISRAHTNATTTIKYKGNYSNEKLMIRGSTFIISNSETSSLISLLQVQRLPLVFVFNHEKRNTRRFVGLAI